MSESKLLLNAEEMENAIREMSIKAAALAGAPGKLAFVGIRTHGVTLAQRLREHLKQKSGLETPLGVLDINLYRDDLDQRDQQPIVRPSRIDFDLHGMTVILVDDVLYTGRTIRCALDQLMDYGRPRAVRLAVLVDRGLRELPIQPDITGLTVATQTGEKVEARFHEKDQEDGVWLIPRKETHP